MKTKTLFTFLTALLILLSAAESYSQMFWNQAAKFENSGYLAVPNSSHLNISGGFTLEAWINPTASIGHYYILSKNLSGSYGISLSNGRISILTNGVFRLQSRASYNVPLNKWTHVAGTYNYQLNQFEIYINGRRDTSSTIAGAAPLQGSDSLLVGKYNLSHFSGMLDEVRIWQNALTPAEIARNMRTSLAVKNSSTGNPYSSLRFALTFQNKSPVAELNLTDWTGINATVKNNGITGVSLINKASETVSYNEALELDGSEDFAFILNTPGSEIDGPFTLETWLYLNEDAADTREKVILKKWENNNGFKLMVNTQNRLVMQVNNLAVTMPQLQLPLKQWVHVAFTLAQNGTGKTYIDGIERSSDSFPLLSETTDTLFIGGSELDPCFKGYLDEIRITEKEKTASEIKGKLYTSITEGTLFSSTEYVFNCDGSSYSAANSASFNLSGNIKFSAPAMLEGVPVSPLLRNDQSSFPTGFRIKTVNKRIPETGGIGYTIDTLNIPNSAVINDINIFIATNHLNDEDMQITLTAPGGDSVRLYMGNSLLNNRSDIITIFDNDASIFLNGDYTAYAPSVKPISSIATLFNGTNAQGKWILRIHDNDNELDTGRIYAWGLQINNETVGIQQLSNTIPEKYSLSQNYPNPFNPVTNIKFNIQKAGIVKLAVYDVLGKQVATLVNEVKQPGAYVVDFDASQLSSGVYFYRLETEAFTDTKRMLLVK